MNHPESKDGFVTDIETITVLISRARLGCEKSRDDAVTRLEPFVVSTVSRHNSSNLNNKVGASDIVQLSLLKVFEKFEAFRGNSSQEFRAWMKQVVVNEIRQLNRNWKRKCRDVGRESSLADERHIADVADPTPGTKAIEAEQLHILKSNLDRLNETEHEIVKLRSIENLTFPEIAERVNKKPDAVTKTWYRSLVKLQQMMAEDDQDK